ncbi:hypothetical protein BX666DRAFT_1904495, partial [Dichotomocladium elegans]
RSPIVKPFLSVRHQLNRMKWVNKKLIWSQVNWRRSFGLMSLTSESIMTAARGL